jgi:nitrite reductase/ring-hydroxylating ferredoxin subunit
VRLKLQGSCNGCASSAVTLKLAIEEAVYEAAPDIVGLDVEGVVPQPATARLVQLGKAPSPTAAAPLVKDGKGWEEVSGLASLASGAVRTIEVSGRSVLFCHLDGNFYAYSDTCPECGQTMRSASLEATALVCPGCGERFDAKRAGRALNRENLCLVPFPLLVEQGRARIALPAFQD